MYSLLENLVEDIEFPIYGTLFYGPHCNFYRLQRNSDKLVFICLGGGPLYYTWVLNALENIKKYSISVRFYLETLELKVHADDYDWLDSEDDESEGMYSTERFIYI